MKTQIEDFDFKFLFKYTTSAGWFLLSRPVIYLLFSRRRDLNAYSTIDFSAIIFVFYSVISCYLGYKIVFQSESSYGKDIFKNSPIIVFFAYCALCLASSLWSVSPILSAFRAFECISITILIIAVIQELFEKRDYQYVILWSLFFCIWDIFFSIVARMRWTLNISELLQSSQMMATSFFFMALYFKPLRWYNYLILLMSIFSMSTVAYIGMAIGSVSAFWEKGRIKTMVIVTCVTFIFAIITFDPYTIIKNTLFFDKEEISLQETSGRDHLLEATIDCVEHNPFGLGFFAAEPYVLYAKHLGAISAHNSLFSAAMGMGIPGVLVLGIFFILLCTIVFSKYIPINYRAILIGCFCVAFFHCMGNPSIGTRVFGAWIPCMYIFVLISGFYVSRKYYENDF